MESMNNIKVTTNIRITVLVVKLTFCSTSMTPVRTDFNYTSSNKIYPATKGEKKENKRTS